MKEKRMESKGNFRKKEGRLSEREAK